MTPAPQWNSSDVGAVGLAGSWTPSPRAAKWRAPATTSGTTTTRSTSCGARCSGDGEIVARVASVEYIRAWSKAGVMIRANLTPGSPHAFMLASAGKGYAFQRRAEQAGLTTHTTGGTGTAPVWLRLVRSGDTISAYRSADGASWILVGSDTILMPHDVLIGLAVSSHTATATCRATFEHVTVR